MSAVARSRSAPAGPGLDESRLLALTGHQLRRTFVVFARAVEEALGGYGVGGGEFAVLVLILDNPGTNQKGVGRTLGIDPANLANLLHRLERRKWVRREADPADQRAWRLRLTPAGRKTAARALEIVRGVERERLTRITPPERAQLGRILRKLAGERGA